MWKSFRMNRASSGSERQIFGEKSPKANIAGWRRANSDQFVKAAGNSSPRQNGILSYMWAQDGKQTSRMRAAEPQSGLRATINSGARSLKDKDSEWLYGFCENQPDFQFKDICRSLSQSSSMPMSILERLNPKDCCHY